LDRGRKKEWDDGNQIDRCEGPGQPAQGVRQRDGDHRPGQRENELRIRKASVIPEDEIRFVEETPVVLSDQERERFLHALDHPPKPNAALRRLMVGKAKDHG